MKLGKLAGAAAILIGLTAPPAQAGYVVDLTQEGSDVVATGSGALDLTGLSFVESVSFPTVIWPGLGLMDTGPSLPAPEIDVYNGSTGPRSFGSGGYSFPSSGSGDPVGIVGSVPDVYVPAGYVSGSPLSDTSTYGGQTFSSLGVTPGKYEWTWGTGANQNFTLVIGTIPEPSTWAMMLIGFAGLGFAGYRARRGSARSTA